MFKKYDINTFKELREQHNILALVGNGFDISILKNFQSITLPGKTTSYMDFYDYITYFNLTNEENLLYRKMTENNINEKDNWSDFEKIIGEILDTSDRHALEASVDEFQTLFTRFLNDLVDMDILLKLNKEVEKNKLSIQSLGGFLKDIDTTNNKVKFMDSFDHYDLFNFTFINFNYTFLLDNYIYLDKAQFDPHMHKNADTNFWIKYISKTADEDECSTYLLSQVIHPHGIQSVPRSILFGIDLENYDRGRGSEKRFVKGYWSQYDAKYKSYLEEANLFIIYGMSLGLSDAWWFDGIYNEILNRGVELIIYMFGNYDDATVKEMFISSCYRHRESDDQEKEIVKQYIHVVTFERNNTYFLGLENKSSK
ncbi:AbiH family protein [Aerococcus urinae]|uniref:AbiH family protein n=1 Tax=Aerococcus urinae TaxID=1376 RepID=UPI00254E4F86|nr:AbiH family protein [Aerococcus urinae]MDK6371064.1 AbiH family protein [Aerococcus urinae]